MFHTNEHTRLISQDGGKDVEIKPNAKFNAFKGRYKVTSSARIIKDDKTYCILNPGEIIDGIGEVITKPKPKSKPTLKMEAQDG